jgi:hypothetical protein
LDFAYWPVAYIKSGIDEGAEIVTDGKKGSDNGGYFGR